MTKAYFETEEETVRKLIAENPWLQLLIICLAILFVGLVSSFLAWIVVNTVLYLFGTAGVFTIFYVIVPAGIVASGIYLFFKRLPPKG